MIFAAQDRLAELSVATETRAVRIGAAAVEGQHLRGDNRLMLPMAHPDELEPARPSGELIVTVDVGIINFEILDIDPAASLTDDKKPIVSPIHRVPIGRIAKRQIADRRAGAI